MCFTAQQHARAFVRAHDLPPAAHTDACDRGPEGGPGGGDPVPAEGDGERDGKKDL